MTDTPDSPASKQGGVWRLVAGIDAWLGSFHYTGFDYTHDRIDLLEQKVAALTAELREGVASQPRDPSI